MVVRVVFGVLLVVGLTSEAAHGGGQFVGSTGAQAQQRAGAFVARADDPTAIFHNPGALLGVESTQLFVGANLVSYDQSFERDGTDTAAVQHEGEAQPVPFMALSHRVGDKVAIAAGVFAPQGYPKRNFSDPAEGAPAPQRYDTVSQSALMVLPSAAVAIALSDQLSVGGRVSYGYFETQSTRYVQGVSNNAENPDQDSRVTIDARDSQVITYGVGVHFRASPTLHVGVSYTAPIHIDAVGTSRTELGPALREPIPGMENTIEPVPDAMARCAPGGTADALKACIDLSLPQTATAGVRWVSVDGTGRELGDVEIDVTWENWAAVSDYHVRVDGQNSLLGQPLEPSVVRHGFQDVIGVRVGGSMRLGDRMQYQARGGVAYETAAAPDSWTRLDVDGSDRVTIAGGVGVDLGRYRLDLGAAFIDSPRRNFTNVEMDAGTPMDERLQPDITVPLSDAESQPYHPFNAGTYENRYLIGSVGLTAWW